MYVIIKINIDELDNAIHSYIISVSDNFSDALNKCSDYITLHHNKPRDTIYRESKNRFTYYQKGLVYGRTLKCIYEIINHPEITNYQNQPHLQNYEIQNHEVTLTCPLCSSVDSLDVRTDP